MEKCDRLNQFFEEEHPFRQGVVLLRQWLLDCGLQEDFKWSLPTYTWNNKNIASIGKFKQHYGVWFFQGGLLADPLKVLQNAQEGKTKAMRHWKFTEYPPGPEQSLKAYLFEAIENEKAGKRILPAKSSERKPLVLPDMLRAAMVQDSALKLAFESLSAGKQRDYAEYLHQAKKESTRMSRWEKIEPMIRAGKGLNDQYRK